jgi:cation diffusion facilitator CzcD-associated flavoprotein CzcO
LRTRLIVVLGGDWETYSGALIHSSEYRNPEPYAGKRVLVIGFGNSGGEIALDLANAGVDVALAVRNPVQILPRDLLGFPILSWAILYRNLPARLVDAINAPVLRLAVGNFEKLGLRRAAKGPRQMVEEDGRVPLIDIGTLARIRDGSIKVRGGVDRFTPDGVVFTDAAGEKFDAVILATGFSSRSPPDNPGRRRPLRQAWHATGYRTGDGRARALFLRSDHGADRATARDWDRGAADRVGREGVYGEV